MGMAARSLPLLMALKRRGYIPNGSAVIEIGAQQLDELFRWRDRGHCGRRAALSGITSPPPSFAWTGPAATPCAGRSAAGARILDLAWAQLRLDRYRRLARQHSARPELRRGADRNWSPPRRRHEFRHHGARRQPAAVFQDRPRPGRPRAPSCCMCCRRAARRTRPRYRLESKILLDARPQQRLQDRLHDDGPVRARRRLTQRPFGIFGALRTARRNPILPPSGCR